VGLREQDDIPVSIDAALHDEDHVIIIPEQSSHPPMLRELQHLAGPPPPPPPPTMYQHGRTHSSGLINIAIDESNPGTHTPDGPTLPMAMERAQTTSPSMHRKNAPSGSSWMRGFGDRMRSSSKSRTKSPVVGPAPYETVLPPPLASHVRRDSLSSRAKSPYEQAMAMAAASASASTAPPSDQIPIPPPPPPPPAPPGGSGSDGFRLNETSIPPFTLPHRSRSSSGYRHPREIRANMPPDHLQQGVYGAGGMI
jgi:hypothetical protein